jgi:restriction system protein
MRSYYRIMLGRGSAYAGQCFAGGFVGTDFGIEEDLSGKLPEEWRDFNKRFIPVLQAKFPDKGKVSAGLACGALWTVSKGIRPGDFVLCPDGAGSYRVGEVLGEYYHAPAGPLPHRRKVRWLDRLIPRAAMSEELQRSTGSIGTVSTVTGYAEEIERLVGEEPRPAIVAVSPEIEDPAAFAMEKHLEEFLVMNWGQTVLAQEFSIYEEDGEPVGQQYMTDVGPIDILAVSKDRARLLIVELKRGRASDVVVGQVLRYMGFVQEEIAETGQKVEGAIIALEDDPRLRRALRMVPAVSFYRYQISFKLVRD